MAAILRATTAHIDAHHGDVLAALAAAKAMGGDYDITDGYRAPLPRHRPYAISEAEAERLFQAGCQAARDAAQSPEFHAQTEQRIGGPVATEPKVRFR